MSESIMASVGFSVSICAAAVIAWAVRADVPVLAFIAGVAVGNVTRLLIDLRREAGR